MRSSKASLFLMELMISILFFSLSSAVCIQLFVKAHTINETTSDKSNATQIAQDVSETFYHTDGDKTGLLSYFTDYEEKEGNVFLYFSKSGVCCSESSAAYTVTLTFSQESSFRFLDLTVSRTADGETLYTSSLQKYIQTTL